MAFELKENINPERIFKIELKDCKRGEFFVSL